MIQKTIFSLIALTAPLYCMEQQSFEHRAREPYPDGIGYMAVEDVIQKVSLPTALKGQVEDPNSPLYINIYLTIDERKRNRISSLGYDPYQKNTHPAVFAKYRGPVIHSCTKVIMQHLLKQANLKTVIAAEKWLYHHPDSPINLDDYNYFIVASDANQKGFIPFANLPSDEKKKKVIQEMVMEDLYAAIKYIHYAFPDENNVYVNPENNFIMLPNAISPDNEGLGTHTKYGKAILGQDLNKAKHNIRNWYDGGHRTFEDVIKKYGDQEDLEHWNSFYTQDPIFKENK